LDVELDPRVKEKKEKFNKVDEEEAEIQKKREEENEKIGNMTKLWKYNNPKWYIVMGSINAAISGVCTPVIGIAFAKILAVMTMPEAYLAVVGQMQDPPMTGSDYFTSEMAFWCIFCAAWGVINVFSGFFQKYFFGLLGESVALQIKTLLYEALLQKHTGFYDERENAPTVLTSAVAMDTQLINGVGSEAISP